ncbi:hypothetical protein COCOBI_03-1210 [Coccomyxa sp. Obi]|nr:hypothetical protein COCOBI_03-1210 [Coccomyxa sp. Obi]
MACRLATLHFTAMPSGKAFRGTGPVILRTPLHGVARKRSLNITAAAGIRLLSPVQTADVHKSSLGLELGTVTVDNIKKHVTDESIARDLAVMVVFKFNPNDETPEHTHEGDLVHTIIKGPVFFSSGGSTIEGKEGDSVYVQSGTPYGVKGNGTDGYQFVSTYYYCPICISR